MFKIISAVFSTGFAIGAASALLAIHRGHIELPGNEPAPEDDASDLDDTVSNGSGHEAGATDPLPVDADRVGS